MNLKDLNNMSAMFCINKIQRIFFIVFIALILIPSPAKAYIGPGAGFAFVSSFLILFITFVVVSTTIFTWPLKWLLKILLYRRKTGKSRARRVVVIGLDGQDPDLTEKFMQEGLLPNFSKLANKGSFKKLQTTLPAESPVAWSSFQTGCNPGKHRIYDFLVPNRKAMLPELSSASVTTTARTLKLGKYIIPLGKPKLEVRRKSQPFWKILGKYGIFSTIIRVPITFPPEKFKGVLLSAMCLPDIKGSQGTFFYYTSDPMEKRDLTSGEQLPLRITDGIARGVISGPENTLVRKGGELKIPFEVRLSDNDNGEAELIIEKKSYLLYKGEYTPWIQINYKPGLGMTIKAICRFMLLETTPHLKLYLTPIQIDPEKPALPISHPFTYSIYLAKSHGPFATLGVAEDTSALNEHVIDEKAFLKQCYSIHVEREAMLFDALEKTPEGAIVCVFDITDRLQHMFYRFIEDNHPADKASGLKSNSTAIKDLYISMDQLIGCVMQQIDKDTLLLILSDHGLKPFRREVNLNAWLKHNGYLTLKKDAKGADMLQDVQWSKTKAYAVGFGGIYLNVHGREAYGIVQNGHEAEALKTEIASKLRALYDEKERLKPVKQVYDRYEVYSGPYVEEAPDLIVGFRVGYRVAWDSVTGKIGDNIIKDNKRPWSGDHNMNPADVPGMLFCNRHIQKDKPHIVDIAPTVLDLFGVPVPGYFDGEPLLAEGSITPK